MSMEIEVGLENAARVPRREGEKSSRSRKPPKGIRNPKVRGC